MAIHSGSPQALTSLGFNSRAKQVLVIGGTRDAVQLVDKPPLMINNSQIDISAAATNALARRSNDSPLAFVYQDVTTRLSEDQEGPLAVRFFENLNYGLDEASRKWFSRQVLLQLIAETSVFYRMSLVPTNPDEIQTWFMEKKWIFKPPVFSDLQGKVARSLNCSFNQEEIDTEVTKGMVLPWQNFSSNLAKPQHQYPDPSLNDLYEIIEIKDSSTLEIIDDKNINNRLRRIAYFFFLDAESRYPMLTIGDHTRKQVRHMIFTKDDDMGRNPLTPSGV